MDRHATSFGRNIAPAQTADRRMHEILAHFIFDVFAFRDITQRTVIMPY